MISNPNLLCHIQFLKSKISTILFKEADIFDWGDPEETLVSCLGKNYLYDNLTYLGLAIQHVFGFIEKDYTIKSIKNTTDDKEQGLTYEFWSSLCESVLGYNPLNKERYEKSTDIKCSNDFFSRTYRK